MMLNLSDICFVLLSWDFHGLIICHKAGIDSVQYVIHISLFLCQVLASLALEHEPWTRSIPPHLLSIPGYERSDLADAIAIFFNTLLAVNAIISIVRFPTINAEELARLRTMDRYLEEGKYEFVDPRVVRIQRFRDPVTLPPPVDYSVGAHLDRIIWWRHAIDRAKDLSIGAGTKLVREQEEAALAEQEARDAKEKEARARRTLDPATEMYLVSQFGGLIIGPTRSVGELREDLAGYRSALCIGVDGPPSANTRAAVARLNAPPSASTRSKSRAPSTTPRLAFGTLAKIAEYKKRS